jgi:hypothetical protein
VIPEEPLRPIDVILPYGSRPELEWNLGQLPSGLINSVIVPYIQRPEGLPRSIKPTAVETFTAGSDLMTILERCQADFTLLILPGQRVLFTPWTLQRFLETARDTDGGLIYSDFYHKVDNGQIHARPVVDYQLGSLRDDFEFGPLIFFSRERMDHALKRHGSLGMERAAGLYDLRLKVSTNSRVIRIPELLYTTFGSDTVTDEGRRFEYLRAENRKAQIEMERVLTDHLRRIRAFLEPEFEKIPVHAVKKTASIIIPVKNRERTIADAVESALSQKTRFDFNVIAVDNHSTDKTSQILEAFVRRDRRLIHLIPSREDLLIGGCWNAAIHSPHCGAFAIQLDSDDLYADTSVLEKMVDRFEDGDYAMIVGAYRTTDFHQREIPPGVVDHREWTRENGRNNLLRVNGLGAPRAFNTSLVRHHPFPNVSYGEDYAVSLRLSRSYEIGRLFDPIYICRRWEGNSDAALSVEQSNQHDLYKDRLRTVEILARQRMNAETG